MSDRWIVIRNWEQFQHRDAIRSKAGGMQSWIKDYTAQLHNDDWVQLSLSQRGLLQALRLEYAASSGRVRDETRTRLRLGLRQADAKHWRRNLDRLEQAGFIEIVLEQPRKLVPHRREVEVEVEKEEELRAVRTEETSREAGNGTAPGFQLLNPDDILATIPRA